MRSFIAGLILFSIVSHAKDNATLDGFVLWQPSPSHQVMVIPKLIGEADITAVENYLAHIERSTLADLVPTRALRSQPEQWKFHKLNGVFEKRLIVVANQKADHNANSARLKDYLGLYEGVSLSTFVFPVGSAGRLNASERVRFHKMLGESFGHILFIGGADVTPHLYGQEVEHANVQELNPERDLLELSLYRDYRRYGKGRGTGVCRGAQLGVVGEGFSLVQDLKKVKGVVSAHVGNVPHQLKLTPAAKTGQWADILRNEESISCTCQHHQAWNYTENQDALVLLGYVEDESGLRIPELYQTRDGRFLFFQPHPERSAVGKKIRDLARAHLLAGSNQNQSRCESQLLADAVSN